MMITNDTDTYKRQAALAIDTMFYVAKEECFALKGGTAINFFIRQDLPRLSVDIDLDYLGFEPKAEATIKINEALSAIVKAIRADGKKADIKKGKDGIWKIARYERGAEIKVEINYITRGFVYKPELMSISKKAEDEFGFAKMQVMALPELYGGKIHAALKRQHPRDLFDIKILFENEGITEEIKKCFIVAMFSSKGAPYELLNPNIHNRQDLLTSEFSGMTDMEFTYADHEKALQKLIKMLHKSFTKADKDYILGFFSLQPKWHLVDIPNIQKLPALQWKVKNLEKMNKERFEENIKRTEEALY
jgi:predicted nucleotidyltransferase component of viral defense system